ncbi:Lipase family protein [hydrothermal vent metagenome]|uniref:Lipase family protein n=1 Tax=hydrothermal vent metagenome TaxID=652676 RepID=A0A3B1B6N4_9ZZZZ
MFKIKPQGTFTTDIMLIQPQLKYSAFLIFLILTFASSKANALVQANKNIVDFKNIKEYANLANAAYKNLTNLNNTKTFKRNLLTHHSTIPEIKISYFLTTNNKIKTQNIAVRGTTNIENTLVNLSLKLTLDKHTGVYLHKGFLHAAQEIYNEIKPKIKLGYTINTTGHSLGGAIALILAMQLDSDKYKIGQVITFGQPKVTNITGAYKFQHLNIIRVVTAKDIIPLVPFIDPMDINNLDIYWHQGKEIILLADSRYAVLKGLNSMLRATKFTQQPLDENNFKKHQMTQYLIMLNKKIPNAKLVPFKNNLNLFNLF